MHNQCGQSPAKIPRLTMQGLLLLCHWECFTRVLSHVRVFACLCLGESHMRVIIAHSMHFTQILGRRELIKR